MEKRILRTSYLWVALLMLAACTQDETMDDNTLPEGKYPLEIASVTMSVESSSKPWNANAPQTRVAESEDGNSSVWEWNGTEKIGVQFGSEQVTYTLEDGQSLTPSKQLYWQNKESQSLTAWYPAYEEGNGTIDLSNQTDALAYVLQTTETANFDKPVTLGFKHQLAKVRIVLVGVTSQVYKVEINNYTSCSFNPADGTVTGNTSGYIAMKPYNYLGIGECWEANVVPGTVNGNALVRLNDTTAVNITGISSFEVGSLNTITLSVTTEGEISIQSITVADWPVGGEHTLTRAETDGSAWTWQSGDQVALNIAPYNGTPATYTLTYGNDARWTASSKIGEMLLPATVEAWWPNTASASEFSFQHDSQGGTIYINGIPTWLEGTVDQSSIDKLTQNDWMTSEQITIGNPSIDLTLQHRLAKVTLNIQSSETINEVRFFSYSPNAPQGVTSSILTRLAVRPLQNSNTYTAIVSAFYYNGDIGYLPFVKIKVGENNTEKWVYLPRNIGTNGSLSAGNAYTFNLTVNSTNALDTRSAGTSDCELELVSVTRMNNN